MFLSVRTASLLKSSVQSLSPVPLFATPWIAPHLPCPSPGLLRLRSLKSVMPSNHLILCHPLLLPPSVFPSIRVFSNESVLHIRWPEYWSFSFSISPSSAAAPGLGSVESQPLGRQGSLCLLVLHLIFPKGCSSQACPWLLPSLPSLTGRPYLYSQMPLVFESACCNGPCKDTGPKVNS